ncbi:MAG: lytic transglycosylase domain-containing protein [Armatimonadetes bacterium]|nr:lytic transglycosylase domain-containing protein [Armatimonadota bacterium]
MLEREAQWAAQQQKSALGRRKASLKRSRAYTSTRSNFPSRGAYSPFDPGVVDAYTRAILYFNPRLPAAHADLITQSILAYSVHYNVDARLIVAIIAAESRFNPNATSRKGAMGLGQLMPGTARGLGVSNAYDPQQNVAGSVRMVRGLLEKYMGSHTWQGQSYDPESIALALASYNAGSGAVRRYKGIPPYRETRNYVVKVWNLYRQLCGG